MSFYEYMTSRLYIISDILRYRKAFKNYVQVIYNTIKKKYPIRAVLRNGESLLLQNRIEVYTTSLGLRKYCTLDNDLVVLSTNGLTNSVKFHDAISNGDVCGVFLKEEYNFLPVSGKIVVDVGANIGDSAIYFANKGASSIIALEPFPKNYETAKKNIELNQFSNKIKLYMAGCSSKKGELVVDAKNASSQSELKKSETGTKIPLITLEEIIKQEQIDSAILKIDCEGCEYDIILNSPDEVLKKFTHIQIEYHYGYKNLKKHLEKHGFQVSVTKPSFNLNYEAANSKMYIGFLYATKI